MKTLKDYINESSLAIKDNAKNSNKEFIIDKIKQFIIKKIK